MHVVVASTPFGGHQPPLVGLATELVRRGHRVTYYTGRKYRGAAEQAGAQWLPWSPKLDFDENRLHERFPTVRLDDGLTGMFSSFEQIFFGTGPGQLADLDALHRRDPVDVVVAENTCLAGPFLHEARGVPWVGFSLSPLALRSSHLPPGGMPLRPGTGVLHRVRDAAARAMVDATLARRFRDLINAARSRAGLPATDRLGMDSLHSPLLHLAQGVPGLEYPRPDLPAHVHFIGDAAGGTRRVVEEPDWLRRLDPARPVVHVTAGTIDDSGDLVRPAVEALAGTPAQVVVGGDLSLVPQGADVIAPGWVPHDLLLPRCSVVVTNGGYGAVLATLVRGVPLVVAPAGKDKPEVARRVAWSGAGIDLRRRAPDPARLRRAVETCLGDSSQRRNARRLADEFATAGGAVRAAELVDEYVGQRPRTKY